MTTKTFKIGYGLTKKIKLSSGRDGVQTWWFDWNNKVYCTMDYNHDDLNHLELDLYQAFLSDAHVDSIMSWVMNTKEYKDTFKTHFTFYS